MLQNYDHLPDRVNEQSNRISKGEKAFLLEKISKLLFKYVFQKMVKPPINLLEYLELIFFVRSEERRKRQSNGYKTVNNVILFQKLF